MSCTYSEPPVNPHTHRRTNPKTFIMAFKAFLNDPALLAPLLSSCLALLQHHFTRPDSRSPKTPSCFSTHLSTSCFYACSALHPDLLMATSSHVSTEVVFCKVLFLIQSKSASYAPLRPLFTPPNPITL